ncbi:bifunctional protein-serine/threonine kinase/phosphatase [Devosia sp.]|uniref:bifunctional protein-serine/threonine kinase/phosphatase n=1 Tax=Devosia sp. TaxID=1871048 RepID=UPI002FC727CE
MKASLAISIGQHSDKGRKPANQDFHGALIPDQPLLDLKGIAIALADGISSSPVSSIAAQTAVKSFLTDYYATPESWPVKTAAHRVIAATNGWLHAQTRGLEVEEVDQGYVCTLSILVLRSRSAHIFHVGDSRISRLSGRSLEQLTVDHRIPASSNHVYLARALGVGRNVEIDYRALPVNVGDIFVLTTDGVHEHVSPAMIADTILTRGDDLDAAAKAVTEMAHARGSNDNLTVQIVRVDALPDGAPGDFLGQVAELPLPPALEPRMEFDGYRIVRALHANSRSQVFLAEDMDDGRLAVIKVPGSEMRESRSYLTRFMMEEWIARRINSAHVLKSHKQERARRYLYHVSEYVEGQTLTQWMIDHPRPDLNVMRDLVEQITKGLRAFHRLDMLHQDLRPDNIMIDQTGTVKIIDFGSTRVSGIPGTAPGADEPLGAVQYTAPEYFVGEAGTERSDLFALGVITYQMLTGRLPYGAEAGRARTRADLQKLRYVTACDPERDIPFWVNKAIEKAVRINPDERYEVLSEFTYDLRHPNPDYGAAPSRTWANNNVAVWKGVSLALSAAVLVLLAMLLA